MLLIALIGATGGPTARYVAAFFFAFGFTGFAATGASGVPSIADRRPEVNV